MVLVNETSITKWAKKLRTDEILSVIAGWDIGKSPSSGTFYDFLHRLQDGPYRKKCSHIEKPSELDKGWHIRNFKKEEKKKKKDAGHDAVGNYFYFRQKNIPALIPLNKRGAKEAYKDNIKLSSRGIPLWGCIEMRHISYNKKKMKHSSGCPVKRGTHRKGTYIYISHTEECPLGALCSPDTKHGHVVSISSRDNPGLFPDIPRSSQKFKELYKLRTGTERSNSAKKEAYPLQRASLKSRAARLIRLYLIAIVEHRKAIYKEDTKGLDKEQIVELISSKI
jgi:hypothetical protein